jgi:triosephosphate isomerase
VCVCEREREREKNLTLSVVTSQLNWTCQCHDS